MRTKESVSIRLLVIAVIGGLLLLASYPIQNLIQERKSRKEEVVEEIGEKWGDDQEIVGPFVSIPVRDTSGATDDVRYVHIMPENLDVKGDVRHERRYRGIYEAVVYEGDLSLSGTFSSLNVEGVGIRDRETVIWEDAYVGVGIRDKSALRGLIEATWNGEQYEAKPGLPSDGVYEPGIHIEPDLQKGETYTFDVKLTLGGQSSLTFVPIGKTTNVSVSSNWPTPSFSGEFLPVQREVTKDGFTAQWKVSNLNRGFPQKWEGENYDLMDYGFGVELFIPVDNYHKNMRAVKYAIMFIILAFASFFLIDILSSTPIHPVRYLLVGASLLSFYTLLLSLSEYLGFEYSYLLSSLSAISLITTYASSFLPSRRSVLYIFLILFGKYLYLYVLIQLQHGALLVGSVGLFVVLAAFMYATRNVDWFEVMSNNDDASPSNDRDAETDEDPPVKGAAQ